MVRFVAETSAAGDAQLVGADEMSRAGADRSVVVILVVAALCLNASRFVKDLIPSDWSELSHLVAWAVLQLAGYGLVPVLCWRFVLHYPVRSIGLRKPVGGAHVGIYAVLVAVAVPFVVLVSGTSSFQAKYPFLHSPAGAARWDELVRWWPFYAAQFVAIEVFFRGFLVLGLAKRFGALSVFVSIVPYTMIHFGKPPLEALAAVVGGVVMGCLALRSRSVWLGVALHVLVAATMEAASLWHQGLL